MMNEVILAITLTASKLSGYPMTDAPLRVVQASECRVAGAMQMKTCNNAPMAVYLTEKNTLYIQRGVWRDFRRGEHYAVSTVLHEMVHYLQDAAGKPGPAPDWEREAYAVEIAWGMSQGLSRAAAMEAAGINERMLAQ